VTYAALGAAYIVTGLAATLWAAATKTDPTKWSQPIAGVLTWAQANAWEWLFWLILLTGAAQSLRRHMGPPWQWTLIENMLGEFRKFVFGPLLQQSEEHHHRVTLFKRVWWCWTGMPPWGGWAVPMARSGHTTRHGIAKFRAPDNADDAQGIAGRTWAKNDAVFVSGLPDLGTDKSDGAYRTYAEATSVTVQWVKKRLDKKKRPLARSFGGYPVLVAGKPWGVLVLDSRSESGVTKQSYDNSLDYYKMLARFLGQLLERAR